MNPGARLGPYEIVAAIGAGGMGEVYRAHDTKLGRDVALKILPDAFASDRQVSTNGGRMSMWTRDGRELLYLDGGGHLTSVAVEASTTTFRAGTPVTVLHATYSTPDNPRSFDVSPDGKRFLMIKESNTTPRNVIVMQHFDDELSRLVPAH